MPLKLTVTDISLSTKKRGPEQNLWYIELDKVFHAGKKNKRTKIEAILQHFMDVNRCLFPELRTTDLKGTGDKIKKERE